MPYMVTFTINIPPMLAYIPYMDPMGYRKFDLFPGFFAADLVRECQNGYV